MPNFAEGKRTGDIRVSGFRMRCARCRWFWQIA
jgi:hypothetical protein